MKSSTGRAGIEAGGPIWSSEFTKKKREKNQKRDLSMDLG